jgi:hypothetical protein
MTTNHVYSWMKKFVLANCNQECEKESANTTTQVVNAESENSTEMTPIKINIAKLFNEVNVP